MVMLGHRSPGNSLRLPPLTKSLSAKLLLLTIVFVMLAEVMIYAPSIARMRLVYLEERLAAAHLSARRWRPSCCSTSAPTWSG